MAFLGPFSRFMGPRYVELAKTWAPTVAVFGGTAAGLGLYITDWKVIARYIPFYGSKFPEEKQE